MMRLARAGTREVMLSDTVKFARAAGESEWTVLRRHVLRLISIPLVTVFGLELGSTLAFAVVTETIFSWPGVGKLIIDSIASLDRPVMVAYLMLVAFVFIMINFTVDLVYAASIRGCGRRGVKDRATPFAVFWSEFGENRVAVAALGVVVLVVLLAVFAPLVAPQDPYDLANLTLAGRAPPAGLRRRRRLRPLAGHRRAGARPVLRHPLRAARSRCRWAVSAGLIALSLGRHARRGSGLSAAGEPRR